MADTITQLAHDLEWLSREAPYFASGAAGPQTDLTVDKPHEILRTAEKLERQLKSAVRYNPNSLVGVDYPLESILDSIAELLEAIAEIKAAALAADRDLPAKAKHFRSMIENTFGPIGAEAA
jgi:hypothetical protein